MAVGRQFGREASIYLAGFVGAGVVQFLAIPVYTRALGPQAYGFLALTIAATTIVGGIMVLGGDVALARFWADAPTEPERRELAATWIGFLTVWSVIVAGIAVSMAPWLAATLNPDAELAILFVLGFLALVPAQLSRMLAQILRNRFRPVPYAATLVLSAVLNAGFGILLGVVLDRGVAGILLGTIIGESLGGVVRACLVRRSLSRRVNLSLLPPLLRFGVPYVPASLATWAFTGADRLVLGASAHGDELGSYGLAASLVVPFTVLTLSVGQAWIPRVASLYTVDPGQARAATGSAVVVALGAMGLAATGVGAIAPWVVPLVGGSQFASGAAALPFLALGAAFYGATLFTSTGLTLTKRTGTISLITVAAAGLDVLLLLTLVPRFGTVGAGGAVAASFCALAWGTAVASQRHFPLVLPKVQLGWLTLLLGAQATLASVRPGAWQTLVAALLTGSLVAWSTLRHVSSMATGVRSGTGPGSDQQVVAESTGRPGQDDAVAGGHAERERDALAVEDVQPAPLEVPDEPPPVEVDDVAGDPAVLGHDAGAAEGWPAVPGGGHARDATHEGEGQSLGGDHVGNTDDRHP